MAAPIDIHSLSLGAFRLGEWLVDPQLGRLTSGSTTVSLELKVMDVLLCLARCSGNLVTRQDLIDGVWAAEYVSDNTLTHAIAELRAALGDDAKNPAYIETVHRRGYRLLLDAFEPDETQPGGNRQATNFFIVNGERTVQLRSGNNLIGRVPWATVTIKSVQVSRRHACIVIDEATAIIKDLNSKNGTYLNNRRLDAPVSLADGDQIGLGSHIIVLQLIAAVTTEDAGDPTGPGFEA